MTTNEYHMLCETVKQEGCDIRSMPSHENFIDGKFMCFILHNRPVKILYFENKILVECCDYQQLMQRRRGGSVNLIDVFVVDSYEEVIATIFKLKTDPMLATKMLFEDPDDNEKRLIVEYDNYPELYKDYPIGGLIKDLSNKLKINRIEVAKIVLEMRRNKNKWSNLFM